MKLATRDLDLAASHLESGAFKSALKIAKRLQKAHPSDPMPWNIAGIALSAMNKLPEAISQFQRALKVDPGFVDARYNLAQTLILAGFCAQAAKLMEPIRHKDPKACFFLAQARLQLGNLTTAQSAINEALALRPAFGPALNLRGIIHGRLGMELEALADFEAALARDPANVEALVNISLPLARQNRHAEAHHAAERATQLAPQHIGARLRLGTSFLEAGQFEQAQREFRTVLSLQPGHPEALARLTLLGGPQEKIALARPIKKALGNTRATAIEAADLQFALSRVLEADDKPEQAASARAQANAILARHFPYDAKADTLETARILDRFRSAVPPEPGSADGPRPIYVLGLPRSGTSLVEAMLSRLPEVATFGERAATGVLLQDTLSGNLPFDSEAAAAFARGDRERLPACPPEARAYVDKMPENYRYIGFLKTAYPHCKIVHVRRDPRDVALSMWKSHFTGSALSYTYDLTALAHRVGLYAQFMAHWQDIFPDQILTVDYEHLVADPVAASRAIAEYCDLTWSADMARPEGSSAPTLTMSASQIRQPVHRRSVGGWREHAKELAPFLDAFDTSLWPDLPV